MSRRNCPEPPKKLARLLDRLQLLEPSRLGRYARSVGRLSRGLTMFESAWIDALVRSRRISPMQAQWIHQRRGRQLRVGPYLLEQPLDSLGYAKRYLARTCDTGQRIALTVCPVPESRKQSGDGSGAAGVEAGAGFESLEPNGKDLYLPELDAEVRAELDRLVNVARRMQEPVEAGRDGSGSSVDMRSCPTPILPTGWGVDGSQLWIAQPVVDGITAADYLVNYGRLTPPVVRKIARQMVETLLTISDAGLHHGDISVGNLMFTRSGHAIPVNGAVRPVLRPSEGFTRIDLPPSCYDYLAPERITQCRRVETSSEIFALGALWWHLLAGRPPMPGGDTLTRIRNISTRRVPDIRRHVPEIPDDLRDVITACVQIKPSDRPNSLLQLRAMLQDGSDVALLKDGPFCRREAIRWSGAKSAVWPSIQRIGASSTHGAGRRASPADHDRSGRDVSSRRSGRQMTGARRLAVAAMFAAVCIVGSMFIYDRMSGGGASDVGLIAGAGVDAGPGAEVGIDADATAQVISPVDAVNVDDALRPIQGSVVSESTTPGSVPRLSFDAMGVAPSYSLAMLPEEHDSMVNPVPVSPAISTDPHQGYSMPVAGLDVESGAATAVDLTVDPSIDSGAGSPGDLIESPRLFQPDSLAITNSVIARIDLPTDRPLGVSGIRLEAGAVVGGVSGRSAEVVLYDQSLVVTEPGVTFEYVDFLCDVSPGSSGSATVRVETDLVVFSHCTFRLVQRDIDGHYVPVSAVSMPIGQSATGVYWRYPVEPDPMQLTSGQLEFRDCVFDGVTRGLVLGTSGTVSVTCDNVLYRGSGPMFDMGEAPSGGESLSLMLSRVTLRGSGPLLDVLYYAGNPGACGRTAIRAEQCVFTPHEQMPVIRVVVPGSDGWLPGEVASRLAPLLESVHWTGEDSIVGVRSTIAGWTLPGGVPQSLSDAGISIAGLVRGQVVYADRSSSAVSDSARMSPNNMGDMSDAGDGSDASAAAYIASRVIDWQAPLHRDEPPGYRP